MVAWTTVAGLAGTVVALGGCGGGGGNHPGDGGGGGITGPAPTAGGCLARPGATFCLDFDGSGDDVRPFGWAALSADDSFITSGVATSDGNRSFTITELGTNLGDGTSQLYAVGSGNAVTLDVDLVSTVVSGTSAEVAFLELATNNNALAEVEFVVGADGTIAIAGNDVHISYPPMATTGKLAIGEWASLALHATFSLNTITVSADASALGATPTQVFPATPLALSFTPTQVAAQAGLEPAAADKLTFEFDNVALTMP